MLLAAVGAAINMQWTEAVLVGAIVNGSGLIQVSNAPARNWYIFSLVDLQTCMGLVVTKSLAEASASAEGSVAVLAGSREMVELGALQVSTIFLMSS